jgi:hypothetical protein
MRPYKRTSDFHSENTGSNPVGDAMNHSQKAISKFLFGLRPEPEK